MDTYTFKLILGNISAQCRAAVPWRLMGQEGEMETGPVSPPPFTDLLWREHHPVKWTMIQKLRS